MGATFEPNPGFEQEIIEEVRPQIQEIGDRVAAAAEGNIQFPGGRSGPVGVTDTERGVSVALTGPFAHLEEWGGAKSAPTAPLRRAVEGEGLDFQEI